jgi:hypothetical protein
MPCSGAVYCGEEKVGQETNKQFQESKTEHDRMIRETNRQFQETYKTFKA